MVKIVIKISNGVVHFVDSTEDIEYKLIYGDTNECTTWTSDNIITEDEYNKMCEENDDDYTSVGI